MKCVCGAPLPPKAPRGRSRQFCSDRCASRARMRALRIRQKQCVTEIVTEISNRSERTFYFSGIEKDATAKVLVDERACGMMSQLLYRDSLLVACKDIPLVVDSGAYSIELTRKEIEKYAALIGRVGRRVIWYAAPDKIGDQERSEENYHYLLSLLSEEMQSRILWIYQASAPVSYLYRAVREHKRVGIGGLVPLFQAPDKAMAYQKLHEVISVIAGSEVEDTHFFGASRLETIRKLQGYQLQGSLRRFSIDSTTWLVGGKYGLLVSRNGKQQSAKEMGYDFVNEELLKQNVRTMKSWMDLPAQVVTPDGYAQTSWLEAV